MSGKADDRVLPEGTSKTSSEISLLQVLLISVLAERIVSEITKERNSSPI